MRQPKTEKTFRDPAPVHSTSQLARELGLSRWTISRVINNHPGIHPDTVERVREAMRRHRFSPNPLAQGLRRGRTNVVGICAPDIESYFLGPKLERLRMALSEAGYQVMIGLTDGRESTEAATLDHFRQLRVSGVVLFASRLPMRNAAIAGFQQAGIPLLRVDPHLGANSACLRVDRAHASREVVRHLLALGHRSFATLGIHGLSSYTRTRLKALRAALDECPEPTTLLEYPVDQSGNLYEAGEAVGVHLAEEREAAPALANFPTALLALNDRVALGVIAGLKRGGIRVPHDCSVVGYDNMEFTNFVSPRLTTVDTGALGLMDLAAASLLNAIQNGGKNEKKHPAPPVRLPTVKPTLITRDTTAPPGGGLIRQ